MNTTTALTDIIAASEVMSTEARRTQGRSRYGAKFDAAARHYQVACRWLAANDRPTFDAITVDNHIDSATARNLLAAVSVAA